jgi:hypothetical protein
MLGNPSGLDPAAGLRDPPKCGIFGRRDRTADSARANYRGEGTQVTLRGPMQMPVKWVAELAHVLEVSLLGTADLAFWKERLQAEKLCPAERDGQAQVLISAADAKYWGKRFREVSFSVLVSPPNASPPSVSPHSELNQQNAAFLVGAYNSLRMFAFVERAFFSTPYNYGDVRVSAALPAFIHLVLNGKTLFRAEMAADGDGPRREPASHGEDGWQGPVFLPEKNRGKCRPGKLFFTRIRGQTSVYPLLLAQDLVAIEPSSESEVLQALQDSHFVLREWLVRPDAAHAKSKTYKRTDLSTLADAPHTATAQSGAK